ncbi:MAG TPA: DinB family protein [Bryobacteraceae bacterium]|nr:DinB family protein [Bryobacteraceae bacterium]
MTSEETFLQFSADKLEQLHSRIQDCLARLTPEQIWARHSESENAVGNLILHLSGNVRQWIGSGVAGLPDHRERDAEFDARGGKSTAELAELINRRVLDAVSIIRSVPPSRLNERITPQGHGVTVLEAIAHVVEHFSMHTGQVILLTKLLTGQDLAYYQYLRGSGRVAGAKLP